MNLIEQIKQKALQAKSAISSVFNKGNSMSFPTTSEALSKSTQIGKNEEAKGYYGKQDNSIINSPLLGEIKNKVGLNYEDAQTRAWREGLKVNPQLAAQMGNNPALYNVDMTGSARVVGKQSANVVKPVAKNIFQGFKDLSTKLVEDLKGKSIVPKSYIEQRLVSSDLNLKQVEKDLIRSKLQNYPDKINVNDLAENIKTDLLPLNIKKPLQTRGFGVMEKNRYERIALPQELRGNVQNYSEHIYESPIKTSAGDVHFNESTNNYFGHTRIEDLADSSLDKALHKQGGTRRVIEVQSDLYQRGRLDNETNINPEKNLLDFNTKREDLTEFQKEKLDNKIKEFNSRELELNKLKQYNDPTAHYRMVREEVKQAAVDGKSKLQFPTGETAMKIEGLGDTTQWSFRDDMLYNHKLTPDKLKVGQEIQQSTGNELLQRNNLDNRGSWIITEVLEDGKFKAVPKNAKKEAIEEYDFRQKKSEGGDGSKFSDMSKEEQDEYLEEALLYNSEQFDISGKVDTNNPIYKFYEKDLGKYLKSKFNAKEITDKQGVKWYELDIKPEFKDKPVEAFGFTTPEQMFKVTGKLGLGLGVGTAGLAYKGALDKMNKETDLKKEELGKLKTKLEELKNKQPKTYDEKLEYVIPRLKVEIDSKGQIKGYGNTLAADNNNPGNLRFAGQKNAVQGRGGFAKFETPQLGFRALIKQVQKDQSRDLTLEQFIHKYSPPSENDTIKYIKFLEDKLDVKKTEKINKIPSFKLAEQVAMFESQTKISY